MGAGKSTALAAARSAGLAEETVEVDDLMEAAFGMPIRQAFERRGRRLSAHARRRSSARCWSRPTAARSRSAEAACSHRRVRDALDAPSRRLAEIDTEDGLGPDRATATGRWPPTSRLCGRLLEEREPLYESLADAVVPPLSEVGGSGRGPAGDVLAPVLDCRRDSKMLWAHSASGEYPVYVGRGPARAAGTWAWPLAGRRFCVTDETVGPLYAERLRAACGPVEVRARRGGEDDGRSRAGAERARPRPG